jgi:hypothetical protein
VPLGVAWICLAALFAAVLELDKLPVNVATANYAHSHVGVARKAVVIAASTASAVIAHAANAAFAEIAAIAEAAAIVMADAATVEDVTATAIAIAIVIVCDLDISIQLIHGMLKMF